MRHRRPPIYSAERSPEMRQIGCRSHDITEHRTHEGTVDRAVVLDTVCRQVVGWSIDSGQTAALGDPPAGAIVHSDRVVQVDDESFWGRTQTELLNRKRWKTRIELTNEIFDYPEIFHNRQPRHSALGMHTPKPQPVDIQDRIDLIERARLVGVDLIDHLTRDFDPVYVLKVGFDITGGYTAGMNTATAPPNWCCQPAGPLGTIVGSKPPLRSRGTEIPTGPLTVSPFSARTRCGSSRCRSRPGRRLHNRSNGLSRCARPARGPPWSTRSANHPHRRSWSRTRPRA